MQLSKIRLAVALATLVPPALGAQRISFGAGATFADRGSNGLLAGRGFTAFGRIRTDGLGWFGLAGDVWMITLPQMFVETPPCPSTVSCSGGWFGPSTAFALTPTLIARERYENVQLLYRVGPTASWFPKRDPSSPALGAGFQAGLTIVTTHGHSGALMSVDYLRLFRGGARPRWFVPVTLGWQF